jgi:sporulation protein YlmC with PRC-barrel domain
MHKMRAILGVIVLLRLLLAAGAVAQPQEPNPQGIEASKSASHDGPPASLSPPSTLLALRGVIVSTESLLGSKVKNLQGEKVGTVQHLIMNPRTGLVLYAVVSIGGFLGMGEKTLVVPWQALEVAHDDNTLVLKLSQRWLQQELADATGPASPAAGPDLRLAGSGGWGPDTPYGRLYNPAAEQTSSGKVLRIDTGPPMPGMVSGIQLIVKTDADKTLRIQIGPAWYLEHQEVKIVEHNTVQVTGAMTEIDGQPVLLAREVQFDGHILTLRDAQGMPMWSGVRRPTSP